MQCDKNSIVKSATKHVQELKGVKEALQQRYEELKAKVLGSDPTEGRKVKIRVANLSSPVDSMIGVLRCMQSMDATAKAIRAHLSSSELSAVMSIDTKVCRNVHCNARIEFWSAFPNMFMCLNYSIFKGINLRHSISMIMAILLLKARNAIYDTYFAV